MKRTIILTALLTIISLPAFSQELYFEGGFGLGRAKTKIDSTDFLDTFRRAGLKVNELSLDVSLKFGYGPLLGQIPLYVVGEFSGLGHRVYDRINSIQLNSYLIGPGIIYYPVEALQFAASLGYSFMSGSLNIGTVPRVSYNGFSGWSFNASAALDLGQGLNGSLLGAKYTYSNNSHQFSGTTHESHALTIFIRYAFRHRVSSSPGR